MAKVMKISEMSKDFGMKAKDVIEGFKEVNIEKNTGASVSDVEFEIFMQHMTSTHQIHDLEAYTDGKITIKSAEPKKKAPKAAPEAKAEVEVKAEPKPEPKVEVKPEIKAEPKAEPKVEPKVESKVESKPEPKAAPKPEAKAPEARAQARGERPQERRPAQGQGQRPYQNTSSFGGKGRKRRYRWLYS